MRDPASPEASTFTKITADKPADKLGEFAADHGLSEAVRLSATGKKHLCPFVCIRGSGNAGSAYLSAVQAS